MLAPSTLNANEDFMSFDDKSLIAIEQAKDAAISDCPMSVFSVASTVRLYVLELLRHSALIPLFNCPNHLEINT